MEKQECQLGYTEAQLQRILGPNLAAFNKWMTGQTMGVCDGRVYDHDERKYYPNNCGPHGGVVYGSDLRQFLAGGLPLD